jgi:hypothetical protein
MDKAEECGRQQLLELLGDMGTRPADEVAQALAYREQGVNPGLDLATVIARPDDFRERLLAELALAPDEIAVRAEAAPDERHAYCLHTFALYLLALWDEPRAYQLVVSYLTTDPAGADAYLDDILVEDMPAILARTYDGSDLGPLKALIENTGAPPFVRDACLRGLHAMARLGKLDINDVVAYFEVLAGSMDHPANEDFIDVFAMSMAALQEQRLRPIIDRWFAAGKIDRMLLRPEDIDANYGAPYDELNEELTRRERFDELIDYLSEWSWFNAEGPDEAAIGDDDMSVRQEPHRREGRKIGRNEPCPCGSGKKYKACCLGNDT